VTAARGWRGQPLCLRADVAAALRLQAEKVSTEVLRRVLPEGVKV
jgi:hypothetical protein